MITNLGHKSSELRFSHGKLFSTPSHDGESTSESTHKPHISFCFSRLEGLVPIATEAWENCFFFLSRNVPSPEFWLDTFCYLLRRTRQLEAAIDGAQQPVRIAGNDPATLLTRGLLLAMAQKFTRRSLLDDLRAARSASRGRDPRNTIS